MMNNLSVLFVICALSFLIFGCGSVQIPKVAKYSIDAPNARENIKNNVNIAVERVRGRSLYEKKSIVVSPKIHNLDYYVSSQWAETPCNMLTDDIIAYLAKKFPYVTSAVRNGNGKVDFIISVYIDKLDQEKRDGKWYANLVLHYEIVSNDSKKLLASKWFRMKTKTADADVESYVTAQNDSIKQFLEQLVTEIEKAADVSE
jgi:ABC-type uncharacterized transport system auxiliary subunit